MWYTPDRQMTYNRLFNFVIGVRGGGKTFNSLAKGISKFLKDGSEFIYLRRSVVELDNACVGDKNGDLFAYIRHEGLFEDHELKVTKDKSGGYIFYCDGKVMGYGQALSVNRRSISTPNVNLILFDEFLIDPNANYKRYLKNEPFEFNNFYETVARGRDIPVFFIGNAFSMVNPYFTHYNIRFDPHPDKDIYAGKFWTCVLWKDEKFLATRANTQFYQMTAGTTFHDHAYGNTFYLDTTDFIKKRSKNSEHQFSFVYLDKTYGVWADWNKGNYYISTKGANTSKQKTISLSLADNKPNNMNLRRYRNIPAIKAFRMAVDSNDVFYDNMNTYHSMKEVVYLLKTVV